MQPTNSVIRIADDEIVHHKIIGQDSFDKTIRCTYFIVVLFTTGSGIHSIDGVNHKINGQQLHFLFPGQHHHWETGPDTKAQRITIGRKILESFSSTEVFHLIRYNPYPVFKLASDIFHAVERELKVIDESLGYRASGTGWDELIAVRMNILALMISREAEKYIKEHVLLNAKPIVQQYWSLVEQNFAKQKAVSWYADKLQVGSSYLNLLCKKNLNVTAKQLIEQRILLNAKHSLRSSGMSVKEIAYDLGFASLAGFSAYFKEKTGFSPNEYRA